MPRRTAPFLPFARKAQIITVVTIVTTTGIIPAQVALPDKKLNDTRPVRVEGLSTINPLFWQAINMKIEIAIIVMKIII